MIGLVFLLSDTHFLPSLIIIGLLLFLVLISESKESSEIDTESTSDSSLEIIERIELSMKHLLSSISSLISLISLHIVLLLLMTKDLSTRFEESKSYINFKIAQFKNFNLHINHILKNPYFIQSLDLTLTLLFRDLIRCSMLFLL